MTKIAIGIIAVAALAGTAAAQPVGTQYLVSTWGSPSNSVVYLDAGMNSIGSFNAGSDLPNGLATDGSLIWTGHFTTQEVIAYNLNGVQQFSWPATSGIQGIEFVNGDIAVAASGNVDFYNAFTGAFNYSIPSQGGSVEALAFDGVNLFQLGGDANDGFIYATNPLTGAVNYTIPNPAVNDSFGGTALGYAGGVLVVGSTNGNWYHINSGDGSLISSGNNGLDMYGADVIPAPGAAALLGLAGLTAARRRR